MTYATEKSEEIERPFSSCLPRTKSDQPPERRELLSVFNPLDFRGIGLTMKQGAPKAWEMTKSQSS